MLALLVVHGILGSLLYLVVVGLILAILWWAKDALPMPAPFKMVFTWVLVIAAVIVLIDFLAGLLGRHFLTMG